MKQSLECSECGEPLGKEEIAYMKEIIADPMYFYCFGCDSVRDVPYEVVN